MACDTKYAQRNQTPQQRADEIRKTMAKLSSAIATGVIRPVVGKQGAIAFAGWQDADRSGISDACAYRKLMIMGSPLARAAIARAEALSGRGVSRAQVAAGTHSHDNGATWHKGH